MEIDEREIKIATEATIRRLLEPIREQLNKISSELTNRQGNAQKPKYYRNNDLKNLFRLSNNTIVKYRETGVLPYTKLGDIYLYEVKAIDAILKENTIKIF
ncbi:helix-turn-helix domain-containing protein [Gelidibacter japonicus]|uniref:helix-turn-helix domain-containing protein n=1 Tax=Gelidibacter japonicus TaxID=1962232 RepID=UPI003A8CEFF5